MTLDDRHRNELHASGLTDETIEAAGIYSAENAEIAKDLGWQPKDHDWGRGMVFPYPVPDTDRPYARVKLDFPRHDAKGKAIKYESPQKTRNRAYFPTGTKEALSDTQRQVLITEGEKKSLCATQHGFPCIGLGGVWSWQQRRRKTEGGKTYGRRLLIDDLTAIHWQGRPVVICFDSDSLDNPAVHMAECRLAEVLLVAGASVRVARLPANGDGKTGLDDYIVTHGANAFRKVIDDAGEADKPPKPSLVEWGRMYLAERFTAPDGHTLRAWRGEFYRWIKTKYVKVPVDELRADVLRWLDQIGVEKPTPKLALDIVECIRAEVMVRGEIEQPVLLGGATAEHPRWLSMSNGILDMDRAKPGEKAALRKHTPQWFSMMALPYPYDPEAKCDTWFDTLSAIFDGDEERVALLGEWFGYCLTDDTRFHSILLCEGPPRGGKGTVQRALRHVIGADNCCAPRLMSLGELFGLWGLVGKRVAIIPDAHLGRGDKAMQVLETLKSISGEDAVEVHRKNLPPINVRLRVRFHLACNELPKFGDGANALTSRVLILPFRQSFVGKEDRDLEAKIEAEAPGILLWALEGLARLLHQGHFTRPAISIEVEDDFARLVNPLRAFLEDHCEIEAGATVNREQLWLAWSDWCDINGHLKGSRELLGSRLRVAIPNLDHARPRMADGTRPWVYVGIRLVTRPEAVPNE